MSQNAQPYMPKPGQQTPVTQPGGMPSPGTMAQPQVMPSPVPQRVTHPSPQMAPQPMQPLRPQQGVQPAVAPAHLSPPMPPQNMPPQNMPGGLPPLGMPGQAMPPHGLPQQGGYSNPQGQYGVPSAENIGEGGEKALPRIAIQAFCDRSETASVIHEMTRDWRMKRVNQKIFMGGLQAAIEYYHKEPTPNLILIESGMRGGELFAQLEQLASVCDEDTRVVIIGAANDIKLYRQLIDKGISEYIVPPFHPLTLIRSISELFNDPDKPFVGKVAAFFGAKGGVGSSTIAHNIAWYLAENLLQETALVDLDASWGTTGLDFAYDATQGLEEALAQPDRLDETLLDRIMLRHTPTLSILPASGSLVHKPNMSLEAYETVVSGVRSLSPLTVLDMPHYWSEWTMSVLTGVDDVVITAMPDLANLRNTKNLVDYLKAERPNDAPPILILNKMGISKANEISVKDFGAAVGIDPALVLAFDPDTYIEAANDGKMLTDVKTGAQAVQGMEYIALRLKTGSFPVADLGGRSKAKSLLGRAKAKSADASGMKEKKSLFSMLKRK